LLCIRIAAIAIRALPDFEVGIGLTLPDYEVGEVCELDWRDNFRAFA
jgi:hypothetical protein